ncbi:MAG: acylphosphatase [Armatimonadota bacterium]|nr:acylphosphatase [bacterium]MCS7310431.1 acylphosphatase [Armatimonadota bacterium]MDW8290920.1 acylphosphatase [Armatimonadota bacterium]
MRKRMVATVSGRVQGVGYRAFVLRYARALGLSGSVRNLPSGQVEVVAEGDEQQLQQLLTLLRQGPPAARVTEVSVQWGEATGADSDFRIAW